VDGGGHQSLMSRLFCRYIIVQLGLLGPLVQITRTIGNEVRTTFLSSRLNRQSNPALVCRRHVPPIVC
jgi:hypothetical protein